MKNKSYYQQSAREKLELARKLTVAKSCVVLFAITFLLFYAILAN